MDLQVQKRGILGRLVGGLRKKGLVPGELYGKGLENIHVSVPTKDFRKIFKEAGENTIINVLVDNQKYPVLIHDVAYDGISGDFLAVDFYRVKMDEKIKVKVPMEFIGIAPGVKEKNGVLVKSLHEIEIEALPGNIPHNFKVDLTKLADIGQSIHIKDLDIPSSVKVEISLDTIVATITAKVTEEEELAMQQEGAAKVEEVKVETEEKKAERDAEKAAAAPAGQPAPGAKTPPAK
ncbi:MAG: 50S ribosomal protein L25 [Candidatus Pacebacteria bacterium]|nr:50S ribosomal protein L25 [Candidatus Paceibacterota bacterium]